MMHIDAMRLGILCPGTEAAGESNRNGSGTGRQELTSIEPHCHAVR